MFEFNRFEQTMSVIVCEKRSFFETVKSTAALNRGIVGTSVYVLTNTLFRLEFSKQGLFVNLRYNSSSSLNRVGSGVRKIGAATCWGLFGRQGIGRSKVITEWPFDQFTGFILVLPIGGPGLVGPSNGTSFHFACKPGIFYYRVLRLKRYTRNGMNANIRL
ncbi:hypothetical protein Hanom_Chr07g00621511 [Helianthus anomalus]